MWLLLCYHFIDDKECDTPGKGGCAHICVEEIGSYHCDCRDGYTLIQDLESCEGVYLFHALLYYTYDSCNIVTFVKKMLEQICVRFCNSQTIKWKLFSIKIFAWCQNFFVSLLDIPECDTNNGGCQHTCFEKPGSYECKCNPGYALAADKHTCESMYDLQLETHTRKLSISKIQAYLCAMCITTAKCIVPYTLFDLICNEFYVSRPCPRYHNCLLTEMISFIMNICP